MDSDLRYVTIITKNDGIGIGKMDSKNRLVWRSGAWIPVPMEERDTRDRILRKNVKRIIEDGGRRYKEALQGLMLPPTYTNIGDDGR